MDELVASIGREPAQRTTLYQPAPRDRVQASYKAKPLLPVVQLPAGRYARLGPNGAHARREAAASCEDQA
jgi:FO synthase